ncbi:hypothetical protein ACJZ2D_010641 [Fusarium nematophilum]
MGTVKAAQCAATVAQQFPNIRFALMIAIGGGIPSRRVDVRLGDVAVSIPRDDHPGVIEYDYGKYENGKFVLKGSLAKPPPILISADGSLEEDEEMDESPLGAILEGITSKRGYGRPRSDDILFDESFHHVIEGEDCSECHASSTKEIVPRKPRFEEIKVHRGLILSGGGVIKNPADRSRLRRGNESAICFEMEAAGIMDQIPLERKIDAVGNDVQELKQDAEVTRQAIQRKEVLDWLQDVNWRHQQYMHYDRREPGTGQWLLDSSEFQEWLEAPGSTLLCCGLPEVGKTVMASIMIDHLEQKIAQPSPERTSTKPSAVVFVYCSFQERERQKAVHILESLLRQLIEKLPALPESVQDLHADNKQKPLGSIISRDVTDALCSVSVHFHQLYIVIDALDECEHVAALLPEIFRIQKETGASIVATSRPEKRIEDQFDGKLSLNIRTTDEDVERYLDQQISNHKVIKDEAKDFQSKTKASLRREIKQRIRNAADGIFLLARFHLDSVMEMTSPNGILETVKTLPRGSQAYREIYGKTIRRIGSQPVEYRCLARRTLEWLVCAHRALTIQELREALAIKPGSSSLDKKDFNSTQIMVDACKGLVVVEGSKDIRLLHHTTREYLDSNFGCLAWLGGRETSTVPPVFDAEQNETARASAQYAIALACVTYLSFKAFELGPCRLPVHFDDRLESKRFYRYAGVHWGRHLRSCGPHIPSVVATSSMASFIYNASKVEASCQVLFTERPNYGRTGNEKAFPSHCTGLHLAALFGVELLVRSLLGHGHHVDAQDADGRTPLSYAAENYDDATVTLLLDAGADMEKSDNWLQTPLSCAAKGGYKATGQRLLERGADIETRRDDGQKPLILAARKGHVDLVEILLDSGADIEARDKHDITALLYATRGRREAVVQVLLRNNANVNQPGKTGGPPLWGAAGNGFLEIAQILLNNGAYPCGTNYKPSSPLFQTANGGHADVVRLLLDAGVRPNRLELKSCVLVAATKGHVAVLELLLDRCGHPDISCAHFWGPLVSAAGRGHEAAVRLLMDHGVSVEGGQKLDSPLYAAALNGHAPVVRLLLDGGADPNRVAFHGGMTPLWAAGDGGQSTIATLLLENGADPNTADDSGQTPLHQFVENGSTEVVELLLEKGTDIEAVDGWGDTPLLQAAVHGHMEIASLLLDKGADPNAKHRNGETPIHLASQDGNLSMVKMLLHKGADPNMLDKLGRTALWMASSCQHERTAEFLRSKGAKLGWGRSKHETMHP